MDKDRWSNVTVCLYPHSIVPRSVMSPIEAEALRAFWKPRGNAQSKHFDIVLEQSSDGILTGRLVCTKCGTAIIRGITIGEPPSHQTLLMSSILIIEDDAAIRHLLRSCLEQAGYEMREAERAKTGYGNVHKSPIHLVITDIFMPDCDGLDVIRRLRRLHPNLKILAISGEDPGPWII